MTVSLAVVLALYNSIDVLLEEPACVRILI